MPRRNLTIAAIILFFFGTIIFTFMYGPAKRTFVTPDKTVSVKSAQELDNLWHSSGVHGRIAVIFARHLHQHGTGNGFPELDYVDRAMRHGIVRMAYYIVPDRTWPEVVAENMLPGKVEAQLRTTDTGFMLLHECGRIHVMPISKYIPEQDREKALVVIEHGAWSLQERFKIDNYIKSKLLTTDVLIHVQARHPL